MAVIIDNQLQEAVAYDPAVYPIAFYQDELAALPGWSGPLHWHPFGSAVHYTEDSAGTAPGSRS